MDRVRKGGREESAWSDKRGRAVQDLVGDKIYSGFR